ncbi:MAG: InlB B-repeat-containing protein [Nitrososphaerota archaeon]|nr:InlB B-repeat-containing protein [Nitrososphaerota archaeon]
MPSCILTTSAETSLESAVHVESEAELRAAVDKAPSGISVVIVLDSDITLTGALAISANKSITLISNNDNSEFFRLIGALGADTIIVEDGGALVLAGITVTHTKDVAGRGVIVQPGGILTLTDGVISGNTASGMYGGGIHNNGNFSMFGGEISDNKAVINIGGNGYGGGVYNGGVFSLFGGVISGNTASGGGGVYNSGTFEMFGGMISGSTAGTYGGGVYNCLGNFSLFGGVISGNTARGYGGGGVCNYYGSFTMSSGIISNNTATNGGGVYNIYYGDFSLSGGMVSSNTATNGGGVYNAETFEMSGGTIFGNTASNSGGGVYNNDNFGLSGGMVSSNTAVSGGGVYNIVTFGLSGGVISNNTADYGGGMYMQGGIVELFDGKISGNTALGNGGGIWVAVENFDSLSVANGVVFSNNYASTAYDRDPVHDDTYHAYIGADVVWSVPFLQGYNNYDIGYTSGTQRLFYSVAVSDSSAVFSGAGRYLQGVSVTLDAGTRVGYIFSGWTIHEGDVVLPNSPQAVFIMPEHNVFVIANWTEAINKYTIAYELKGGTNPAGNPTIYTVADLPLSITDPSKPGFIFAGWTIAYNDSAIVENTFSLIIPAGTTGNITLTANWKEILHLYSIIYVLENGKNAAGNPSAYTITDLPVAIANPIKAGYTFLGWTVAFSDGSQPDATMPTVSYVIPQGTTGTVVLTAHWKLIVEEDAIIAYNKVYAEFSSYYDTTTWQFSRGLFAEYTVESVLEAERIMDTAGQVHAYLLVVYGGFDAGRFSADADVEVIKVATRIFTQAIADMHAVLKFDVPMVFVDMYDLGGCIRVWFSCPIGIETVVAVVDGQVAEFDGVVLRGVRTWLSGVGYIDTYSYIDVAKVNNWQLIVLTLTVNDQTLVLELVNDLYVSPVEWVTTIVEPTCTLEGYTEICYLSTGEKWYFDYVPAFGHDFTVLYREGDYLYVLCTVCGWRGYI